MRKKRIITGIISSHHSIIPVLLLQLVIFHFCCYCCVCVFVRKPISLSRRFRLFLSSSLSVRQSVYRIITLIWLLYSDVLRWPQTHARKHARSHAHAFFSITSNNKSRLSRSLSNEREKEKKIQVEFIDWCRN